MVSPWKPFGPPCRHWGMYKLVAAPTFIKAWLALEQYLHEHWGAGLVANLRSKLHEVERFLEQDPYMYMIEDRIPRGADEAEVRRVLLTKHNLILYEVDEEAKEVYLLALHDTRRQHLSCV